MALMAPAMSSAALVYLRLGSALELPPPLLHLKEREVSASSKASPVRVAFLYLNAASF